LYFLPKNFTILGLFAKLFPTERQRSKCPTKEKTGKEKRKKQGGEKVKGKVEVASFACCGCPNLKSCNLASGTKASLVLDL